MKKFFLLVVGVACLTATKAQIHFGVKAGLNIANLSGSDAGDTKSRVGAHLGALLQVPLAAGLSLQPEVVYSSQGAKADFQGQTITLNSNYINIPVLVKYTFPVGLFVETGPQAGFLLSAKMKSGGNSADVKDSYKSTDVSWAYGVGYKLPLGLGLNVRYNMGLSSIADGSGKIKNSVFQVGAFFMLP